MLRTSGVRLHLAVGHRFHGVARIPQRIHQTVDIVQQMGQTHCVEDHIAALQVLDGLLEHAVIAVIAHGLVVLLQQMLVFLVLSLLLFGPVGHVDLVGQFLPKDGLIAGSQVAVAAATQADDEHTVRPGMVYISMSTELGTMYNRSQLKDLYYTCKQLGLYLFIDGARLGYGLAAPTGDLTPADIAKFSDVFTVGGTKMGALFGEAVVINNPELNVRFRYMIKQKGGMLAKGRLLGLQFLALMEDGLYFKTGKKAVDQAMRIRTALMDAGFTFHVDSPTNQLFPIFTDAQWEKIEELGFKLEFNGRLDEEHVVLRVCTSWCTPDEYVDKFIDALKEL